MKKHNLTYDAFLSYLRHECGLADNSIEAYRRDMRRFADWMNEAEVEDWSELSVRKLGEYIGYLATQKLSSSSVARHVTSLKIFFRFLVLEGYLDRSAASLLHRPSLWERIPHVIGEDRLDEFLTAPQPEDKHFRRDRAILEMLYATGARASEVATLTLRDLDLDQRVLRCFGKGSKERLVPFSTRAKATLQVYLSVERPILTESGTSDRLFVSRTGKSIDRVDIWKLVKKYAARVGMAQNVSPHTLRHSFATHMLAQGADLRVIQELLGHASIATTQHYLRVDTSRMKSVHRQFHPRA
ncbi:tyrosine recombinase [bacterium]|nr:tyrosine recombinase [bacterium]